MRIPLYKHLHNDPLIEQDAISISFAQPMHPNPRFYKYRWWVFWEGSPCDGREFLEEKYSMCTADFMSLTERLQLENKLHFIYNKQFPRHEEGVTPFSTKHTRWKDIKFEVPLSQDNDPCYMEHH